VILLFKSRKKWFSLLVILTLLAGLQIPLAGPACAASEYSMTFVNSINAESDTFDSDGESVLGYLRIDLPSVVDTDSSVLLELPSKPSGYSWADNFAYEIPDKVGSAGNAISSVSLARVGANERTLKLTITGLTAGGYGGAGRIFIGCNSTGEGQSTLTSGLGVNIPASADGEVILTLDSHSNSVFTSGTVVIANVTGDNSLTLETMSVNTIGPNGGATCVKHMKEDTAGALYDPSGRAVLTETLPPGFTWDLQATLASSRLLWGDPGILPHLRTELKNGGREMVLYNDTYETTSPILLERTDYIKVDESVAKPGPIINATKGSCTINFAGDPIFPTYAPNYDCTVTAKDTPTVYAGFDEQEIGDIVITEALAETLVEGRTVTLTLPSNARWQEVYEAATDEDDDTDPSDADFEDFDTDEGLRLEFDGFTGTDQRTAKFKVTSQSSDDSATIKLEDVEVAIEAGVTGDLVVTVGGSAGASGEVVVAKVAAPFIAATVSVPNVIIGLGGQAGGDFTLTEAAAGCFDKDGGTVVLDLPGGMTFTAAPKVEVTAGDLRIGNVRFINNDNSVSFSIESESTEPSTITVSGVTLKLDRTVAEGDITLKVQGDAVVETDAYSDWSNSDYAAKFAEARVVNSAPGDTRYTTVFTIGSTAYTVYGAAAAADVAPYIDASGRTMLPIRFAANAAGVSDANILWNPVEQSVILIKGDLIAKLVAGSTTMVVNGVPFEMDTIPVIADPGRVMLPLRAAAQALGCEVTWDAANQTVTVK
jgi:hypothetical protein